LVLFGGKRIPELARGLGKAQAEYKKAKEALEKEADKFKAEINDVGKTKTQKTTAKKTTSKKTSTKAAKKTAKKTVVKSKKQ